MSHNPFARPKPNAKRERPRRTGDRVRLRGRDKEALRFHVYTRANGLCETCGEVAKWVADDSLGMVGELSHLRHGSNKTDTLAGCLWECRECHRKRHNAGGKPCARKPGRTMNQKEALAYWNSTVCFCGGVKRSQYSFCPECLSKLPKQLDYDLENATGKEYLEAMALAEQALLNQETK